MAWIFESFSDSDAARDRDSEISQNSVSVLDTIDIGNPAWYDVQDFFKIPADDCRISEPSIVAMEVVVMQVSSCEVKLEGEMF